MITKLAPNLLLLLPIVFFGCGSELEFEEAELSVAPGGSGASVVSTNFPASFAPGERVNVEVVMQNDGAASPANDWDTTGYRLLRQTTNWGFGGANVTPVVTPGGTNTFRFVVTAPATSPQTFSAQMYHAFAPNTGYFGDLFTRPNVPITNPQRQWSCNLVSTTMPAMMNGGEQRSISVTVQNDGLNAWPANGFCFIRRGAAFGPYCVSNATAVAPGAQHTFTFSVTAPAAPGLYNFRRQMFQKGSIATGSVQLIDAVNNCVDQVVTVVGAAETFESEFVAAASNIDELTTMRAGETTSVNVTFRNSGTATWTAGDYRLYTRNTPANLWGSSTIIALDANVAPNDTHTFTFNITAPATPGNYAHEWRLFGDAPAPGFFGEQINIPVVVDNVATPQYDAAIVSTMIPAAIGVNQNADFLVTVQNTGQRDWAADDGFRMVAAHTPNNLWGLALSNIPAGIAVASGAQYQFTLPIRAPSVAGTYLAQWRMSQAPATGGVGAFGATSSDSVDVVVDCGDSVVDVNIGEQCDDGNTTDGDGCSSMCLVETLRRDLRGGPADRTFVSNQAARGMANSAIGDLNNDGVDDLAVAHWGGETVNMLVRGRAGVTFVHYGGAGFFTNGVEQVDTNAASRVIGARTNDEIGGGALGTVKIGDVTGDGIDDLVLSGGRAVCADGTTPNCGRVYVIAGGSIAAGLVDLNAAPAALVAELIGENAGDQARVIAIGDVSNDGINDLIIGMPGAGGGRGEIAVVAGGAGLTGTINLTGANRLATILGDGANDQLGTTAAIGPIGGTAPNDLIVGAGGHTSATGGDRAGGAWAIFGPLSGTYDLGGGNYNARWRGAGIRDIMGTEVRIGNVMGNAVMDVLISNEGYRDGTNTRYGAVDVYQGPLVDGTDIDLSAGGAPTARIQGEDPTDGFGHCLETVDLNGDLYSDIIAGAWFSQGGLDDLNQAGEMVWVLGSNALADQQVSPATAPYILYEGTSLARICQYRNALVTGDLDNDGRPDVCVGSPGGGEPGFPAPAPGRLDCIRNPY